MSSDADLNSLISQAIHRIVSDEIGPECILKLRREENDIENVRTNCILYVPNCNLTTVMSGSRAEGFDMKTSDYDIMFVLGDVVVIPSYHPLPEGSPQKCVLIYDTDYTSPGFTVIRCSFLGESNTRKIISDSLVTNGLGPLVCSKMFREFFLRFWPSYDIHGPCVSGQFLDSEFDFAYCLHSPYWPREASTFITRSLRSGWPSQQVVTDICNDGCLFVPISSKALHCQDALEMEWRMSFSLAERKLVNSMNYCQFLCYGLLKLFLNEVLKKTENVNDLLCSYFLKTAVFWEIGEDTSGWTSQNFLSKFWKSFCRLLSWVHVGYCPNFFNPDNNMFAGKIQGHKQRLLLDTLRSFHGEGVLCLLKCSSLNSMLTMVFKITHISLQLGIPVYLPLNKESFVSQWFQECKEIECILNSSRSFGFNLSHHFGRIHSVRNIRPVSTLMKAALKYEQHELLQTMGETILAELANLNCRSISNKTVKKYLQTALNILYRNDTTFCAIEIIVAKWFYILGMFHKSVRMLNRAQIRLHGSQFINWWTINEADYKRLRRSDMSHISFIKSSIAHNVAVRDINNVGELLLELRTNHSAVPILCIPPVVFVNFLLLLSYHHLGDTIRRNDVLRDLHALLWYDEGYHIPNKLRAISWEILGICQQLCGDYQGAYQSYINALTDEYNFFKNATIIRIFSLTNT